MIIIILDISLIVLRIINVLILTSLLLFGRIVFIEKFVHYIVSQGVVIFIFISRWHVGLFLIKLN